MAIKLGCNPGVLFRVLVFVLVQAFQETLQDVVETVPSVALREGMEGRIPCKVNQKSRSVLWSKGDPLSAQAILVFMDLFPVVGQKGGQGYESGYFDIADDFLIIHTVSLDDAGQYFCVTIDFNNGTPYWNSTEITIFKEPPKIPSPQIDKCLFNSDEGSRGQNCSYFTDKQPVNITCFVTGDFSNITMYFPYQNQVVGSKQPHVQQNEDGSNIWFVTIQAEARSKPYECVAIHSESSGDEVVEGSTSVLLKWQSSEILSPSCNREKEIILIIGLVLSSVIILLAGLSVFLARKRGSALGPTQYITSQREIRNTTRRAQTSSFDEEPNHTTQERFSHEGAKLNNSKLIHGKSDTRENGNDDIYQ